MKRFALAVLAILFPAMSHAADLPIKAAPRVAAPVASFDGWYVGAQIGSSYFNVKTTLADNYFDNAGSNNRALSSFSGGLYAGWGKTMGNIYAGIEGEGSWLSGTQHERYTFDVTSSPPPDDSTIRARSSVGVAGRLGYLISNNLMSYVRLGWQSTKFEYDAVRVNLFGPASVGSTHEWRDGVRFGGGIEYLLMANLRARLDAGYTWYSSSTVTYPVNSGIGTETYKPREGYVRTGIAISFGQ